MPQRLMKRDKASRDTWHKPTSPLLDIEIATGRVKILLVPGPLCVRVHTL